MPYITEERRMIQEQAREFTLNEVLPVANKLDPEKGDIPMDLRDKMAELGYFGILIPEQYGGLGLGCFEYCLVTEELSRGWMSVASLIARGNLLIGSHMMSEEQRAKYLPRMAKGEFLGAFSMSEPNAGSDIANISCRAKKDGTGYLISGNKYWCTFADGADYINVLCRLDSPDAPKGRKGTFYVAVEKPRGELPANCSGSPIPKIGYFGWKTWELVFDNTRTPVQAVEEADGQSNAFELGLARAHTAARSIGVAQAALDHAIGYAKERVQFGQPISDFQAIRFKIANMATEIEAARQLMYYVCTEIDAGRGGAIETSMVKLFAAEMAERVTSEALQILGGAGYTTLHPVERYWRDARLTKIFEGTSEIQQRIIADTILGKPTIRGSN
jgi:alkylation response protein AidB-like acyl-CoA dehydrogenase